MVDAVIVSTARTPIGKAYRGGLNNTPGATLGGHAIRHALERSGLEGGQIEDVIMGCAMQEGATGLNVARRALLTAREVLAVEPLEGEPRLALVLAVGHVPHQVRVLELGQEPGLPAEPLRCVRVGAPQPFQSDRAPGASLLRPVDDRERPLARALADQEAPPDDGVVHDPSVHPKRGACAPRVLDPPARWGARVDRAGALAIARWGSARSRSLSGTGNWGQGSDGGPRGARRARPALAGCARCCSQGDHRGRGGESVRRGSVVAVSRGAPGTRRGGPSSSKCQSRNLAHEPKPPSGSPSTSRRPQPEPELAHEPEPQPKRKPERERELEPRPEPEPEPEPVATRRRNGSGRRRGADDGARLPGGGRAGEGGNADLVPRPETGRGEARDAAPDGGRTRPR